MPNPGNNMTVEEFRNLPQDQQKNVLDQNYKDKMKGDLKLSDKTLAAQKGKLDKLMLAAYYGIRANSDSTGVLSPEDRFNLGIASYELDKAEEARQQAKLVENAIRAKTVTYDFARQMEGAREVKCSEFGAALADAIRNAEC